MATESIAFNIPQWGSIFIYNPPSDAPTHLDARSLHPIFSVFQKQLLTLFGVAPLPAGVKTSSVLSEWKIDALMRRRAFENALTTKDTLNSIINLVDQIEGMPVDKDVTEDVDGALDYFEAVSPSRFVKPIVNYINETISQMVSVAPESALRALQYSAEAVTRASRAFFNPGMLALLYFPPEHNLAVYTPLLAPVAVPLIAAVLREISRKRRERREAAR